MYIYVYIYIYRERERESERDGERGTNLHVFSITFVGIPFD